MTSPSVNDAGASTARTHLNTSFSKNRTALIVLVTGFLITAIATLAMKTSVDRIAEKEFSEQCTDVKNKISERLDDHARILLSGAAFFKASDKVTREEWRLYTQYQHIDKQLPGIQGI